MQSCFERFLLNVSTLLLWGYCTFYTYWSASARISVKSVRRTCREKLFVCCIYSVMRFSLQLFNCTAVLFVVGSLITVACSSIGLTTALKVM